MFWQKDAETMPRAEIRALQLKKLQHTVKWSYDRVPYYHKIMEESGVTPDQIKSLDDVRRLPFTTKADLRDNYPFGLFAVPKKEIVEIHASSGTTGKPIVGGYTRRDLDVWSDCVTSCRCGGRHIGRYFPDCFWVRAVHWRFWTALCIGENWLHGCADFQRQ